MAAVGLALAGLALSGQNQALDGKTAPFGIPSHAIAFEADKHKLHIHARNSVSGQTIQIDVSMIDTAGKYQTIPLSLYTPDSDRSAPATETFEELGSGWIIGIIAKPSAACQRGQTLVSVARCFGSVVTADQLILHQYVTPMKPGAWPAPNSIEDSEKWPGAIISEAGTNPAAGSEVSESVPTNALRNFRSIEVAVVASGDTANRRLHWKIKDGSLTLWDEEEKATAQTASQTRNYQFVQDGKDFDSDGTGRYGTRMPRIGENMTAAMKVVTVTTGIQSADDIGAPNLVYEELIRPD